jgi:hypothetical protein
MGKNRQKSEILRKFFPKFGSRKDNQKIEISDFEGSRRAVPVKKHETNGLEPARYPKRDIIKKTLVTRQLIEMFPKNWSSKKHEKRSDFDVFEEISKSYFC